jgi:membrane protein insertase Oxa1/YidC/SpoIIIJ
METLAFVLAPIIWVMLQTYEFYQGLVSSAGLSVILVSITFSILLLPLQTWGRRYENRLSAKIATVNAEVSPLKKQFKGEILFNETEKVYKKFHYHPIQNIGLGTSFLVMIPVLLSAIVLFTGDTVLAGKSFLLIDDLSAPDRLLGPVNVMPFVMFAVTLADANIRYRNDKPSRQRFYIISCVLLLLVYNMAAGLILYWTTSNIFSMALSKVKPGTA